jgi:Zn-dependent M16 (insulinase) family peptidase
MPVWNHGADPISAIQIGQHIAKFKENLAASDSFLKDKVRHYLKENQHKLTLIMSPKADYQTELERRESEKRDLVLSKLTPEEKSRLHEDVLQLLDYQSKQHDTSCLPSLSIADIPREGETVELQHLQTIGIPLQLCPQPTNGVTYYRAISSITSLDDDLKPYVPLFCYIITKIGAGNLDYKQMSQEIELRTGGLGLSAHIDTNHSDLNTFEQGVCFSSLCLDRNLPYMFSLWQDIFNYPNFQDIERIRTLVMMLAADMANSVVDNGHSFAMTYSSSYLTAAAELTERLAGIRQVVSTQSLLRSCS